MLGFFVVVFFPSESFQTDKCCIFTIIVEGQTAHILSRHRLSGQFPQQRGTGEEQNLLMSCFHGEWMLAIYFCRASSLRLSMFRKCYVWRLPSKAYQRKGMLTYAISASSHHLPQADPFKWDLMLVYDCTFIISFCSRLLVSVLLQTILLCTIILLCIFTDCMSRWCEVYFLLGSTQDTNYSVWNSSLKGLLNSILVTCKEYGLMQKKMEVTGFLMGVR